MDGTQFNLPREIKCTDLVAECTSRLNELLGIMQSISVEVSNENIVKIQRLQFESSELQSSIQLLFEQMSLKCISSNGTTTETDEFYVLSQLTTINRADEPPNTESISNVVKSENVILHWTHEQAKLMRIDNDWPTQRNQSSTTINLPISIVNCIKNDSHDFAFAHIRPYMPNRINEIEHSRCEKSHSHLNKLSRITASYEMEIQKLDRKLQNSLEKYTEIKCCAVILLDIIDHLKCKLRLTNNKNRKVSEVADKWTASDGTESHDTGYVAVEPLNWPINKISVKSVGSNSIPLSEEQIELPDKELIQNHNDNESKSEVLVECTTSGRRRHGFVSMEFNLKKDKSTQTDRKFNHDENIVDELEEEEQEFLRNFNYHLNGSELLAMTKNSKSKQSRMVRPQKMDCKSNLLVGRRKCAPNDVKLLEKSNAVAVATATDRKKDVESNALHVLKPEINKTTAVTFKKWPNHRKNTNRTIQAGMTLHHSTKQTNQQKSILRSSGTRKTVSNKVADAAYKMTRADENETINETETKTKLTLKPKPKPKLKTLVKHHINKHEGNTTKSSFPRNEKYRIEKETILRNTSYNRKAANQIACPKLLV